MANTTSPFCELSVDRSISSYAEWSAPGHMKLSRSAGKIMDKGDGFDDTTDYPVMLVDDVKREIIRRLSTSPSLPQLAAVDECWSELCASEISRLLRSGLVIDVAQFFRDNNPFLRTFVGCGTHIGLVLDVDVKQLVHMLKCFSEYLVKSTKGKTGCVKLENMTPNAVGWTHFYSEDDFLMCSDVLKEEIQGLLIHDFKATTKYAYWRTFMQPTAFVRMMLNRVDQITSLNLGGLEISEGIFCGSFPNLEELIWHSANLGDLTKVNCPKLSLLSLGSRTSSTRGFEVITRYPSLNRLFAGINFLNDPILSSITYGTQFYQQFWATLAFVENRDEVDGLHGLVITTLSKLNYVAFWKAPEELFVIMGKYGLRFETLQFGRLNQSLTRLCCFDSVLHALLRFDESRYGCYKLDVSHLKMYLDMMDILTLDQHLPLLMNSVSNVFCSIQSIDLFIHCFLSVAMDSSWVIDSVRRKFRSKLRCLTHFSLHINAVCMFDGLDCYLPPTLSCISISIFLAHTSTTDGSKSVDSLLNFIERLADVNAYPHLEEMHLQVWGVRCAESLLNHVADHLSGLRRLTVIAMPLGEERICIINLIRRVCLTCYRLVSLKLSPEMMRLLVNEYGDLWRDNWKLAVARLARECHLRDSCELSTDYLQYTSESHDCLIIPPVYSQAGIFWIKQVEQARLGPLDRL